MLDALIAAALLAAPATPAPADDADLAKSLTALTQQLMDAVGDGKKEVWEKILDPRATVVDEYGHTQTKKEIVDSLQPLPAGFTGSIEIREPKVERFGDTAVLRCEEYEQETVFGQKLVVRYIALITFQKQKDGWKALGFADVTMPTPPPKLKVTGLNLDEYVGTFRYSPERGFTFKVDNGVLGYTTKAGRPTITVEPLAKDVFMATDDEKSLLVFRRDAAGKVTQVIERRKYNDLVLTKPG